MPGSACSGLFPRAPAFFREVPLPASPPARVPVVLSFDFDYFVRLDLVAKYDWGYSERLPSATIWTHRAVIASLSGMSPRELLPFADTRAAVLRAVRRRFPSPWRCPVSFAHSHASALPFVRSVSVAHGCPVRVLNFDAHHDVTYLEGWAPGVPLGDPGCDNWAGHALSEDSASHYHLFYPRWRLSPRAEMSGGARVFLDAVAPGRWSASTGLTMPRLPVGAFVAGVFLCRSDPWVPPWYDQLFFNFARRLHAASGEGSTMCPAPRQWCSPAAVAKHAEMLRKAHDEAGAPVAPGAKS